MPVVHRHGPPPTPWDASVTRGVGTVRGAAPTAVLAARGGGRLAGAVRHWSGRIGDERTLPCSGSRWGADV
ncbi:hypothetical protein FRAHR75_540013 [Frankia sp. Hr75.2]|nr:hypothetical protein FRAHR75_540013 [Frankia sp. Hr75.2]